ncbi:MAG: DUF5107 domain-containing protein [Ruthenibacterium sp.]
MTSQLTWIEKTMRIGSFGPEASVPDLMPLGNLQNKTQFHLSETDEIYEGYGTLPTAYPYRHRNVYNQRVHNAAVKVAVLENDYLRAEFLPEYGGRLWVLFDKTHNRDLLYTNDVLRGSNLAVRNAWFSGGVEWNIGVIGHTPLTTERLFAASFQTESGQPVLRMYEYERIRGAVYQMDFWLGETAPRLFCAMRITNPTAQVVPMYWWSNMAVPEYENGRVLVPADSAYTSDEINVRKVEVPMVGGHDVSRYCTIPGQVDYFFDIPRTSPKFIANVDATGAGMLHTSTSRLQSRKLFSWGNNKGSAHWQEFLTEKAGRYVEIQAGLGKTQYGCIPMAPHTTWDWVETYAPVQLTSAENGADFITASNSLALRVASQSAGLAAAQATARGFAKTKATTILQQGSGSAALENAVRAANGETPLCPHLDFTHSDTRQSEWNNFLQTGRLPAPRNEAAASSYISGTFWMNRLQKAVQTSEKGNWYAYYHLGLVYWQQGSCALAKRAFAEANRLHQNAWTLHAMAAMAVREGHTDTAISYIKQGILLCKNDISYVKEGYRILARANGFAAMAELAAVLPQDVANEPRIRLYLAEALYQIGAYEKAQAILEQGGGLIVPDLREGEVAIGALWQHLHEALTGEANVPVPDVYDFDSFAKK